MVWENYPSDDLSYFGVKVNSLSIIRVDNKLSLRTLLQHFLSFLFTGVFFKGCHWAYPAIRKARELVKKNNYDYILTKNSPSFLVGYYLQKHYNIKWVATWNDPFPSEKYPAPYGKGAFCKVNSQSECIIRIMEKADVHIFPNKRIMDYMLQYLQINKGNCLVIPHAVITQGANIKPQKKEGMLRLIHSGNLGQPRDPYSFLKALRLFIDKHPDANISFSIMGKGNDSLDAYIKELSLDRYIYYIAPMKYSESLLALNNYDVAVIIEAPCEIGIFLPTKVSDFMQMRIPIFSISPAHGVLNDLYLNGEIPFFADVDKVDDIENQLEIIWKAYSNGRLCHNQPIKNDYQCENIVNLYKTI